MECLCPPPPPTRLWNPTPCLFSRALVPALRLPSISPSLPLFYSLPSPSVTSPFPPPHPHPSDPFERVSHENDIFDWPHQYVSLSIWRHSADFLEGLSSHSPLFFFLFFYSDSAPPPLQHHTLLHSCPKWEKKKGRGEDRQIDEETEREALEKKDMDNGP